MHSFRDYAARPAIKPLGEAPLTYAQIEQRVRAAISILRRLDCRAGDRVGICLPNRPEWPVLSYAAALLGLCIVPINVRLRAGELAHVLRHSRPKAIFSQERFLSNDLLVRYREAVTQLGAENADFAAQSIRLVLVDDSAHAGALSYRSLEAEGVEKLDLAELARERSASDPLWLFWTSGTTSTPKGVLLAQSAIATVWNWTRLAGYRADDRVLVSRPLFYIAGHFWCMLGPLLHGALAVIGERFTPEEIVRLCAEERISVLSGNPLLLKQVVTDRTFDATAFSQVRLGYFSGSSISFDDLKRIKHSIPYRSLLQTYGATELTGFACSTLPDDTLESAHASCGYPLPDVEMHLVDAETGVAVPQGSIGTLLAKTRSFIDYVGVSSADRPKLLTDDGWIRTGDLMRQHPDGRYEFIGRIKDLIKVGGENVAASEIERVLLAHPAIKEAAVVAIADAQRGEVPFAYVELEHEASLSDVEIQAWCRERMAPFKVPRFVAFMRDGSWPMTATGKIAKNELASRGAARRKKWETSPISTTTKQ